MSKRSRGLLIYFLVFLVLMLGASYLFSNTTETNTLSYTEVLEYFDQDEISEYELDFGTGELVLHFRDGRPSMMYRVASLNLFMNDVRAIQQQHGWELGHVSEVLKQAQQQSLLVSMLPTLLLIVALVAFWFIMLRQTRGGGNMMSFGKAKPRTPADGQKVTFADVAGADEEKAELVEIVEFLRDPQRYNNLGARIPKGVLLMGPPGTGKTLLAKAVAGEAGVPFYSISGSDFVEMFVGVGASRVRDLFEQAKKNAPAIIFIDEIDAVGRQRGTGLGGGHDEREQTLNQLLVEMDGFGSNSGVIVMAATNRKDILDPALLRPGRFDRQIYVNYPDIKGREEILKVHARNKPIGPDVDFATIAKTTAGFTGADLENLLNEAALLAARKGYRAITMAEIEEATIKVIAGPEKKSHVVTEKSRRLTAYHEAGHAVVAYHCPHQDKVHQVSIIPRGMAGGYTIQLPTEERDYRTRTEMNEQMCVLLGGRVAEKLMLDDISTGASNDLERASATARYMVMRIGFSDKLGPVVYGTDQNEVFLGRDFGQTKNFSESVAAEIDAEVRELIDGAYEKAKEILEQNRTQLERVARYLMKYEKMSGEEFDQLMKGEETAPPEPPKPLTPPEEPAPHPMEEPAAPQRPDPNTPRDIWS